MPQIYTSLQHVSELADKCVTWKGGGPCSALKSCTDEYIPQPPLQTTLKKMGERSWLNSTLQYISVESVGRHLEERITGPVKTRKEKSRSQWRLQQNERPMLRTSYMYDITPRHQWQVASIKHWQVGVRLLASGKPWALASVQQSPDWTLRCCFSLQVYTPHSVYLLYLETRTDGLNGS